MHGITVEDIAAAERRIRPLVRETPLPGNHSPEFAPNPEPTIRTGTVAMSLVLLDVLQKK